ncbi:hypothetical protein I215_12533 [Galbibacter marinus]|uniref:Uncharacterized protein n=1 Tax=Galbibacter marinus TaxID=555500 RepID=K2QI93_9FLAO|nr:hypothetical protein [Galbibacter marinus]EKF54457.1 hypothetical protein I215_12533 [Galbibacter marinus]
MAFSLFNTQSKEDRFWNWFLKDQETYYAEVDNLDLREKLFDDLTTHLVKVHPDLVFEFSPIRESEVREFIISTDGIKAAFPLVEKLVAKAPTIEKWQFNAFRQRVPGDELAICYGDLEISYSDIYFRYQDGGYGKIGIELNIRNFNGEDYIKNAIYILLDSLIGEYDVTMGLDWIEWVKLDESNIENLIPLTDLRDILDEKKAR